MKNFNIKSMKHYGSETFSSQLKDLWKSCSKVGLGIVIALSLLTSELLLIIKEFFENSSIFLDIKWNSCIIQFFILSFFVWLILLNKKVLSTHHVNNRWSYFTQTFDRIISESHLVQFYWLVSCFLVLFVFLSSLMGTFDAFGIFPKDNNVNWNPISLTYLLLTDNSTISNILKTNTHITNIIAVICIIVSVLGTLLFTGLLVSVFSNFLQRRVEDYQKGKLQYNLSDHIIFIGNDELLPSLVKQCTENKDNQRKKVVVMIHLVTEEVREDIRTIMSDDTLFRNIIFYNGRRDSAKDIRNLDIEKASEIFIVGDRSKDNHDEQNLTCLNLILDSLSGPSGKKITILLEDHTRYMKLKSAWSNDNRAKIVVANFYSDWANLIFCNYNRTKSHDYNIPNYPLLISKENVETQAINIIIHGMTKFGVALGVEAIQRLPDLFVKDSQIDSTLTFICKGAEKEMNIFISKYEKLFDYVDSTYIDLERNIDIISKNKNGKALFKIEFIEGDLFTPAIKDSLIKRCCKDNTKLVLFSCLGIDSIDLDSCLYLPDIISKKADTYVLQKYGQETLNKMSSGKCRLYPFGMNLYPWYGMPKYPIGYNSLSLGQEKEQQGNYEEALDFFQHTENLIRIFYAENSIELYNTLTRKCSILSYLGQEKEAKKIMKIVIDGCLNSVLCDNPSAQNLLGYCYTIGQGVKQSYTEAVKWYSKAAEQGYAISQFNLALCYSSGQGVEQSDSEAAKWFAKAAEQGHSIAQFNLASCYEVGQGVEKDITEAVKWYSKAAEQGHTYAKFKIALLSQ